MTQVFVYLSVYLFNRVFSVVPLYLQFVQKLPPADQLLFTDAGVTSHMIERHIQEAIDSRCYEHDEPNSLLPTAYCFSKACLNVLTRDFADMHPSLVINACTPGFIETDMTAGKGASNPPEMGTVAPLHCLFAEGIESGVFFGSDAVRSPLDRYRAAGKRTLLTSPHLCVLLLLYMAVMYVYLWL